MIQKCPHCSQWVSSEKMDAIDRAKQVVKKSVNPSLESLFSTPLDRAIRIGGGLFDVAFGDCDSFECPHCGTEWTSDSELDDNTDQYEQELQQYNSCCDAYREGDYDTFLELASVFLDNITEDYWRACVYALRANVWSDSYQSERNASQMNMTPAERDDWREGLDIYINNALCDVESSFELLDEEDVEKWVCHLWTIKSRMMHAQGNHLEAVRQAIIALPYAKDEDEACEVKSLISGLGYNDMFNESIVVGSKGYGVWGLDWNGLQKKDLLNDIKDIPLLAPLMPIVKEATSCEYAIDRMKDFYGNLNVTDEDSDDAKQVLECLIGDQEAILQNSFSSIPYHERQFIFTVRDLDHIGGCYDEENNIKYVFALDEIPKDITFPMGHPQPNTLYYAHPLRPYYMPFEECQLMMFYEKVQETCRLFQCLGAINITTRCLKGHNIDSSASKLKTVGGGVGYKGTNVSGEWQGQDVLTSNVSKKDAMGLVQVFSPTKAPYVPDDLVWAKEDPELQTLIRQRLDGGMLHFTKTISSSEMVSSSNNHLMSVQGSYKAMIARVSANYSTSTDTTFSETKETEWEISVDFGPIVSDSSLKMETSANNLHLSRNEEEYLEEYKCTLEDGVITDRERRALDRLRIKLGISETRAFELEATVKSISLSPEEKEYLEEYREILTEGDIRDRDRKALERLRQRNGIPKQRADELERLA